MTDTAGWDEGRVPEQTGRVALVTGANSGIGFEAARVLAERGAHVVLACRSEDKARAAAEEIRGAGPAGSVETLPLDLMRLASVREAADRFRASHDRLDLLINNAGIMAVPEGRTEDGFERQMGTNHFGHFALTGLLLDLLLATPDARVVTVSSGAHRWGRIDFDNLHWDRGYNRFRAYGQSKLANLLFTAELQRRLERGGHKLLALSAHPGMSRTELGQSRDGVAPGLFDKVLRRLSQGFLQSAYMGSLPTLRAAVDPDARPGEYYGPDGRGELRGHPVQVPTSRAANDAEVARRLWEVSEQLTEVAYTPLT